MMNWLRSGIVGLVTLLLVACGEDRPPGEIQGQARSPAAVAAMDAARQQTAVALMERSALPQSPPATQILFGDLHVHSTFSLDAFTVELPMMALQGAHPPANACDFARYCANLDFFALTDHSENLTALHWQQEKEIIRQCNALANDPGNQDLIAFAGWEWTQVGDTAEDHWGHKNVIFRGITEAELPARPINSRADGAGIGIFDNVSRVPLARFLDPLNWRDYMDMKWLYEELISMPQCPRGVPVRELPMDCHENAPTPAELFAKLRDWDMEVMVIPHGNTWGIYTPPLASWDKALNDLQHDPELQPLIEVMSGHGNSEEYRSWRPMEMLADGSPICPEPTDGFVPCCWQAGNIMRQRCDGLSAQECERRVVKARQLAAEAGPSYSLVFPDAEPEEWLNCNQCEDCFKPAFGTVPTESVQYAMSLTDFDTARPGGKQRFKFGFIASTDDHTARPGTGYKQYERRKMTFASGVRSPRFDIGLPVPEDDFKGPDQPHPVHVEGVWPDSERMQSFTFPGGIVAVHAAARTRDAVWEALEQRQVYGTSGPRMLLWFDLLNGPGGRMSMGSELELEENPVFEVRAAGAFIQKPGCPEESHQALDPERLDYLCAGECYHPGDERHRIIAIEVVRILPQEYPGEPVGGLIEDAWKRFDCPPDPQGCVVRFEDEEWLTAGRDALYYVRALQEPTPAINGRQLRTRYDQQGQPIAVDICHGDYRTSFDDDCLAPNSERAWSSPIFVNQAARNQASRRALGPGPGAAAAPGD